MGKYRRGLKPVQHSFGLRLRNYISLSRLPTPPAVYGRDMTGVPCQMLGNDSLGNCVPCEQQNATIVWNWAKKIIVPFNVSTSTAIYSSEAGYVPGNPSTDQGTDMDVAAAYWKASGIKDANGTVHKIDDYLWIDKGDLDIVNVGSWLFEIVSFGGNVGDNQEQQFDANKPWSGTPTGDVGGHCWGVKSRVSGGNFAGPTWARWEQEYTDSFLADTMMGAIVPYTTEMLVNLQSLEGFDTAALANDLAELRQEAA
jgi:hypothetical protein